MKKIGRIYLYLVVSLISAGAILVGVIFMIMPFYAMMHRPLTHVDINMCISGEILVLSGILWLLAVNEIKI